MDNGTPPAVADGDARKSIPEHCRLLLAACVHDQHSSGTGLLDNFRNAGIVPIAAHRDRRTEAARAAAKASKHRRKHLDDIVESVTQIGRVERSSVPTSAPAEFSVLGIEDCPVGGMAGRA